MCVTVNKAQHDYNETNKWVIRIPDGCEKIRLLFSDFPKTSIFILHSEKAIGLDKNIRFTHRMG